jgi:hypothetical protein
MAEANVVTTASNALWYTDRCEIVTGSTPVTYQVYATALIDQPAQGNIYSEPAEVPANSSQEIYVGVGNYLTVTGANWTGVEIGGQTSAQAGVGGYGVDNLPEPPTPPTPDPPTLTSVSPNVGPSTGNTLISLTGTNFVSVTGITIGNVSVTNIAVSSTTLATARTPSGNVGNSTITLTTTGGSDSLTDGFYYEPVTTANTYQAGNVNNNYYSFLIVANTNPSMADVTSDWTINYANGTPTGLTVVSSDLARSPGYNVINTDGGSGALVNGDFYTFTEPVPLPTPATGWTDCVGTSLNPNTGNFGGQFLLQFGSFPVVDNVVPGWTVYGPNNYVANVTETYTNIMSSSIVIRTDGSPVVPESGKYYKFQSP